MDINEKILLLAILKKKDDETLMDVVSTLENTQLFSLKEGKKLLKKLKSEEYLSDGQLTLKGNLTAKEVESEFKI
ncbi:MAG: hypothetical protein ACPG9K_06310 [Poseidonibacter sp.]